MYEVTNENGVLWVRITGHIGRDELLRAMTAAQVAVDTTPGLRVWDLRQGSLTLSSTEIRDIAKRAHRVDSGRSSMAILATDDLTYGICRMYSAFRENEHVRVGVFRTWEEAEEWLGVLVSSVPWS